MSNSSKIDIMGTCSNCRRKATLVRRKRGVQLCGYCIEKLEQPGNIQAFAKGDKRNA